MCYLARLAESVLAGVGAFFFSTILITFFGEIIPQAYFSRHALKMGALFFPIFRLYQLFLYQVAKPTAILLDRWLGPEGIQYFQERDQPIVLFSFAFFCFIILSSVNNSNMSLIMTYSRANRHQMPFEDQI
jgi:CBS domain containing-hemolysin-like protein